MGPVQRFRVPFLQNPGTTAIAKIPFEDRWEVIARMMMASKEKLLPNQAKLLAELQVKQFDSRNLSEHEPPHARSCDQM